MKSKTKDTILCLDDNQHILELLFDMFNNEYNVETTNNCEYALKMCNELDIGVIIADQNMPETLGTEFLVKANKLNPICKKILLTGFGKTDIVKNAMNLGVIDSYVSKPWDFDELINIVHQLMDDYLSYKHKIYIRCLNNSVIDDKNLDKFLQKENISTIIEPIKGALIAKGMEMGNKLPEQTEKLATLGQLTAEVMHEIKNPLAFIHGNLNNLNNFNKKLIDLIDSYEQLDSKYKTSDEIEKLKLDINYSYLKTRTLEIIDRSIAGSEKIKKILEDFLMISRGDSFKQAKADITDLIESSLEIAMFKNKERIEIKKDYNQNLPQVTCVESKLSQVFLNLIVNACHAIKEKGTITIKTMTEDNNVLISIADTGHGIPDDFREKIFDPFFTTKSAQEGTGLGLAISYKIIQQHNGKLSFYTKENRGTTFNITIPICA